ncbi:hypothetical protein GCM10009530_65330 [Microbispora corallina]|uniref:Uncharacterized protein n=1 Tax=Microbispora corallina TaxID=83302 RepID=A0ABQ4G9H4_9ACTN|nr:hypothetical protein Mco01_66230 [Microbispora corallina]
MSRMISKILDIQRWDARLFRNPSTDGARGRCSAHGKDSCSRPATAYVALSDARTERKEWGACDEWLSSNAAAVEFLTAHPLD